MTFRACNSIITCVTCGRTIAHCADGWIWLAAVVTVMDMPSLLCDLTVYRLERGDDEIFVGPTRLLLFYWLTARRAVIQS